MERPLPSSETLVAQVRLTGTGWPSCSSGLSAYQQLAADETPEGLYRSKRLDSNRDCIPDRVPKGVGQPWDHEVAGLPPEQRQAHAVGDVEGQQRAN